MNILSMAREGLRPALTSCPAQSGDKKVPISVADLRIRTNGDLSAFEHIFAAGCRRHQVNAAKPFLVILEERATQLFNRAHNCRR